MSLGLDGLMTVVQKGLQSIKSIWTCGCKYNARALMNAFLSLDVSRVYPAIGRCQLAPAPPCDPVQGQSGGRLMNEFPKLKGEAESGSGVALSQTGG